MNPLKYYTKMRSDHKFSNRIYINEKRYITTEELDSILKYCIDIACKKHKLDLNSNMFTFEYRHLSYNFIGDWTIYITHHADNGRPKFVGFIRLSSYNLDHQCDNIDIFNNLKGKIDKLLHTFIAQGD